MDTARSIDNEVRFAGNMGYSEVIIFVLTYLLDPSDSMKSIVACDRY